MENVNEVPSDIRREKSVTAISVDRIYLGDFQKEGTKSAQIRQTVVTKSFYPSKKVTSSHQDNPFTIAEFGFEEADFTNEDKRVAWIDIPVAISNPDDVMAAIPKDGVLFKCLSNRPIITDNQAYAIEANIRTMDEIADKQVIRFGKEHDEAGKIILDANGKPQYRAIFYSNTAKEDVDSRTEKAEDFYASVNVKTEMAGAQVQNSQTIRM
jgi:hypothetical protein